MIRLKPVVVVAISPMAHSYQVRSGSTANSCRDPGRRDTGDRLGGTEERRGSGHVLPSLTSTSVPELLMARKDSTSGLAL